MRHYTVLLLALLTAGSFGDSQSAPSSREHRPNIVIITADDLGWNDSGLSGSEVKTPRLVTLARQSAVFRHFYVHPSCAPTRAALLTGSRTATERTLCWRTGLQAAIRVGNWKLVETDEPAKTELFELGSDPNEQRDLAATNPERVRGMKRLLRDAATRYSPGLGLRLRRAASGLGRGGSPAAPAQSACAHVGGLAARRRDWLDCVATRPQLAGLSRISALTRSARPAKFQQRRISGPRFVELFKNLRGQIRRAEHLR